MMRGSLDTSVVLRLLLNDIPKQTRQAAEILERPNGRLAVEMIVFVEAAHVLERYYQLSRLDISELMRGFAQLEVISCDRALLTAALDDFVRHPALSFEDCCLAAQAETAKAQPLYTFDQKLANQLAQVELVG